MWWYALILLIILGGIVVHAPLSVFFGTLLPDAALLIKAWKEILMVLAGALAVILLTRAHRWQAIRDDKLAWLIGGYVAIHLCSLLIWNGLSAALAGLAIDLRYIIFFGLMYVLVMLAPNYQSLIRRVALWGALIVIGFGTLQIILPPDFLKILGYSHATIEPYLTIDRNNDFVRLQSTLRGPNPYGAYAATVVIICIAWLVHKKKSFDWRVAALAVLATVATYLSYARSAYVALVAGVAIILAVRYAGKVRVAQWFGLGAAMVALVMVGMMLRNTDFVSNVVLHEDPQEGGTVNSNDGHLKSVSHGLALMARQPLGAGVGSSGSASLLSSKPQIIENQYLLVAHEVGWLGLLLFIAIVGLVMWRLWQRRAEPWAFGLFAGGVGLAVIGLLLPVWVDDTVSMVWWGLAGAALAGTYVKSPKSA